jgi:hypothetical protein
VEFDPQACARCTMRKDCTTAAAGHGGKVSIADDEVCSTDRESWSPRARAPSRARRRGAPARSSGPAAGTAGPYRGTRKNLFDVRRAAAIQNLEVLDRRLPPDVALQAAAEMTGAANRSAF